MDSRALRVAMIYISQNKGVSPKEETPITVDTESTKLTLDQRKKAIDDSLDSYYSPVINAYLRKYDDIGQLMLAALYAVSQFGEGSSEDFNSKLASYKVKILNAVGDTALSDNSLKKKFLNDPAIEKLSVEDIDSYIRSELGSIQRTTLAKVKKITTLLSS